MKIYNIKLKNNSSVNIRKLAKGDTIALQKFNKDLTPESRSFFFPHPYDDRTIGKLIDRNETGKDIIYLAEADGVIVGYFYLWYITHPVSLLGIGISDAYQSIGLGQKALALLIEEGKKIGLAGIELTTMMTNEHAFSIYQKMGFEYKGDVENVDGDGKVIIEKSMFMALKPGAQPTPGIRVPPV